MSNTSSHSISDENEDDEFECSECNFKCLCEGDMIEHSVIHLSTSNTAGDGLGKLTNGEHQRGKDDIGDHGEYNSLLKRKLTSHENYSSSESLHEYENNHTNHKLEDLDIKHEHVLHQVVENDNIHQYSNFHGRQPIKMEQESKITNNLDLNYKKSKTNQKIYGKTYFRPIRSKACLDKSSLIRNELIKDNSSIKKYKTHLEVYEEEKRALFCSHCNKSFWDQGNLMKHLLLNHNPSSSLSNASNRIGQESQSDPLFVDRRKIINNAEVNNKKSETHLKIYEGERKALFCSHCNKAFWDKGSLIRHELVNHNSSSYLSDGIVQESQDLPLFVDSIEIKVDDTGMYIPPGWKRQVALRTRLCKGNLKYDCFYITNYGVRIYCKEEAIEYLRKFLLLNIDIDKLNFSIPETLSNIVEVDTDAYVPERGLERWQHITHNIDNTGIYIPEGWQRKLHVRTNSKSQMSCTIIYISPDGERVRSKSQVFQYLSKFPIFVQNMNFSVEIQSNMQYSIDERSIDNTDIYIPEGWERTNLLSKNGEYIVRYISPFGKCFYNKSQVSDYINIFETDKITQVDVEKINFDKILHISKKESGEDKDNRYFVNNRGYHDNKIELKVDNTGIYIPEGWQRKLYKYTKGARQQIKFVVYISPSGLRFHKKSRVSQHFNFVEKKELHDVPHSIGHPSLNEAYWIH